MTLPFSFAFFVFFSASAKIHEDITYVYLTESGLWREIRKTLDSVEDIGGLWQWLNHTFLPLAFVQEDAAGYPLRKSEWSRVLSYNQLQGAAVLEQIRSPAKECEGRFM